MAEERVYGWVKQEPDPRDWQLQVPRRVTASLPPSVDLSANMGPLLNQASLGSCGPHTATEDIEYDQRAEGLDVVQPSRLFIYYTARMLMNTVGQDSGVDNRTMLKALAQYGYCDESLWPYDVRKFTQKPPAECFTAAIENKITSYATVAQQLDQMKGGLASGHPFIFGFVAYPGLESDQAAETGYVPLPKRGETPIGGHDILIFGYDDATGRFKFRNHWMNGNQPWGQSGNGTIDYGYGTNANLASDFWTINAIVGGIPPAPKPTPPGPPSPSPTPAGSVRVRTGGGDLITLTGPGLSVA